jgi:NTE family protein
MERKRYENRYNISLPVHAWEISLPAGVVGGQRVGLLLTETTAPAHHIRDFTELQIPFACVAADLERGEAVVLKHGDLGDAIRASMAIPTIFTPVTIGDRLLVDGGAVRNLPVQDAKALGADIVIAIDVSDSALGRDRLTDVLTIMNQTIGMGIERASAEERALADLVVRPSMPDVSLFGFTEVAIIMERGAEAMRRQLPELRALLASKGMPTVPRKRPGIAGTDTITVTSVRLEGATGIMQRTVRSSLAFAVPGRVSRDDLRSTVNRLYGMQFFEHVDYRLVPSGDGYALTLRCTERVGNLFRVGVRLDNYERAAAVIGALFENVGSEQAFVAVDLRLGRDVGMEATYAIPLGLSPGIGFRVEAAGLEFDRDVFFDDGSIRVLRTRTVMGGVTVGSLFTRRLSGGVGFRAEWGSSKPEDAPDLASVDKRLLMGDVFMLYDGYDRVPLPSAGGQLVAVVERSFATNDELSPLARWFVSASGVLPVSHRLALQSAVTMGLLTGDSPAREYLFTLGGVRVPFAYPYNRISRTSVMGFRAFELSGRQIQMAQGGVNYWFGETVMVGVQGNVASASDSEDISFTRTQYEWGTGITGGALTLLGPVQLTLMTGSKHGFLVYASFGYDF